MMDASTQEMLERLKEKHPNMDLEMVQSFAGTMMVYHQVTVMMESYYQRLGLSKARFMVMIQLCSLESGEGMSIGDIIDGYEVSSATMTGVIDTLEREGFIERYRCTKDRRKVNVRLTDEGWRFMHEFLPVHHRNLEQFTAPLTKEERYQLFALNHKLLHGIADTIAGPLNKGGSGPGIVGLGE